MIYKCIWQNFNIFLGTSESVLSSFYNSSDHIRQFDTLWMDFHEICYWGIKNLSTHLNLRSEQLELCRNASYLYSEGEWFDSRPGYRLTWGFSSIRQSIHANFRDNHWKSYTSFSVFNANIQVFMWHPSDTFTFNSLKLAEMFLCH
jgi:hypothetical protein